MDLSQIPLLTTAIAIIIAWALFALFCSYLHEAIAQLVSARGRFLKRYLFKQLNDSGNKINWASMVYKHGTIAMLTRDPRKPTSDVSPELFAKTLIEVAGNTVIAPAVPVYTNAILNNFAAATTLLASGDVIDMFKQSLAEAEIKATVNGKVDEGLLYNYLVTNIETWYNALMGRVTLWYKKITRRRLFILGALLAALLNVDSIQLFQQFDSNPASKNALIAYYAKNKAQLEAKADALNSDSTQKVPASKQVNADLKATTDSLASLSKTAALPIGISENLYFNLRDDRTKNDWAAALVKVLGILISGFAASFGAPFWFDFLKKIYTVNPKS